MENEDTNGENVSGLTIEVVWKCSRHVSAQQFQMQQAEDESVN